MSSPGAPDGVDVAWHPSNEDADQLLRIHVADVFGPELDPADVRVGRHCARCGAETHGQPWALVRGAGDVFVSLSRSGPHLVTALSTVGPIGIDVESVDDVAAGWDPALVLHSSESAESPQEQAELWCRKEAILKASGEGLDVSMPSVRAVDHDVVDLPAPEGHRAAYAIR